MSPAAQAILDASRDEPADRDRRDLRTFGRRRGRKLSPHQQRLMDEVLPRLRIDLDTRAPPGLAQLFTSPPDRVWLEIGFGGGEHLLWQAKADLDVGLIGCEPFEDGVVKVLSVIDRERLGNIRLHPDDARDLLRWLPAATIDRAFVLFPDPWPKTRHRKRRLLQSDTIQDLARVLRPGAELRLATDIGDYAVQMLAGVLGSGAFDWPVATAADWRQRPDDWPPTRYEAKALRDDRRCTYLRFQRR